MKVSGFSFVRNAVKFDYPVLEAIKSVLPLVDEFVLALGNSEDETETLISQINDPKLKIIHTIWDDSLREGGKVLAVETDKALKAISKDSTWCIYIQGDECLHENDYSAIKNAMEMYKSDLNVEGLLLNYIHFYGTYDWISDSFSRYRREIRIIRRGIGVSSWGDAQGFRIDKRKLRVKLIPATVYHYGWVKSPEDQQRKQQYFNKLWHSDDWVDKNVGHENTFKYDPKEMLLPFTGSHPAVMIERIKRKNWVLSLEIKKTKLPVKLKLKMAWASLTGFRIGEYKNYILLK